MLLLRRFAQVTAAELPHYVKVTGLPTLTWEGHLKRLVAGTSCKVYMRPTYIAVEVKSREDAEKLVKEIHMKKLKEDVVLKAMHLVTVAAGQWMHPVYHIRPDLKLPRPTPLASEGEMEADIPEDAELGDLFEGLEEDSEPKSKVPEEHMPETVDQEFFQREKELAMKKLENSLSRVG